MNRPIFRPPSPYGPEAFKTYEIRAPLASHWRIATCEEVACEAYVGGWITEVDIRTPLGQFQADYIRQRSGRAFREEWTAPSIVAFTFEAGQRCFASDTHRVRVDRAEFYLVRAGDWRTEARSAWTRRHARPEDWVEDFAEHQGRLAEIRERG